MDNFDNGGARAIGYVLLVIVMVVFAVWFYSADASGKGTVSSKWPESHTSCDKHGCTTSTDYMVQLKDSRIYRIFWGTMQWDPLMPQEAIEFNAHGRFISFFGMRVAVPDIFSWDQLPPQ